MTAPPTHKGEKLPPEPLTAAVDARRFWLTLRAGKPKSFGYPVRPRP